MPQVIAPVKPKAPKGNAFTPETKLSEADLEDFGFSAQRLTVGYVAEHRTIGSTWEIYKLPDGTPKRFRHKKQALTFIRREERKAGRIATR